MPKRSCLAIVLAAGEGTRMKSATPKVLHRVAGLPMLGHVLKAADASGADAIAVVIGPEMAAVSPFLAREAPDARTFVQEQRLGTAHAVLTARKALAAGPDQVLVMYGDTPLVTAATLKKMRAGLARGADLVVLGFRPADPARYGRLIMDGRRLAAIREFNDATAEERAIGFCNAGVMAFSAATVAPLLKKIGNDNAKGEYYLTDLVALANRRGLKVAAIEGDADEVLGVDTRGQLARAEGVWQRRAREDAMAAGVTMIAPSTVWFSHDTRLGRDVTLEPNIFFGPGVTVADNVVIRANCHIEGATIASGATIGPFARLRPGADIGENVHIGDFVEVKSARLDAGAKANHLAYIGDAHIGAKTNIGAGTITANYDGFDKFRTEIGAGASIGSNAVLVAPVTIGDGASVAAGSVISRNVPADALAIARGQQVEKPEWARKFREKKLLSRAAATKKSGS
jgi:bifunctional UDP-N-acetylglucosamine pyrophosphorylase / glucosamine-1-phosphate N-acetyltransferase